MENMVHGSGIQETWVLVSALCVTEHLTLAKVFFASPSFGIRRASQRTTLSEMQTLRPLLNQDLHFSKGSR